MKTITLYDPKSEEVMKPLPIPLEMIAISSLLEKEKKYNLNIFDCEHDINDVINSAKKSICLAITSVTGMQIEEGLKLAKLVRKANPDVPIIWGGWHPSLLPEQTLENEYVDIVVRGQGERTFYELIGALENKKPLKGILGVSYKENGKIIHNLDRPFEDPNNFPPYPYHLVDVPRYLFESTYGNKTIMYISSKGCPYRCAFCADRAVYKGVWKALTAERVISDLTKLKKDYPEIDAVSFFDNNFFIDEERVVKIAKGIMNLGLGWGKIAGRVDNFLNYKPKTWEILKESNLESVSIGAESGLDENLKLIKKDITVDQIKQVYALCKRYGIGVMGSFFIGVPSKDPNYIKKEADATFRLMYKLWKLDPKVNTQLLFIYQPYPGADLSEKAIEAGFKPPETFEGWSRFSQYKQNTPWVPEKYEKLVQQVLFYFQFATGRTGRNIKKLPFILRLLFEPLEYVCRQTMLLRLKYLFFPLPVEYYIFRNLVKIRDKTS